MNWVVECEIKQEGNKYVSHCKDLSISSQGDTVEEAESNFVEALEMFLEDASTAEVMESLACLKPAARPKVQQQAKRHIGQQMVTDIAIDLMLQVAHA